VPISEARKRANNKHLATLDEMTIRVLKGRKDELKVIAAAKGKSLNQYVVDAIEAAEGKSIGIATCTIKKGDTVIISDSKAFKIDDEDDIH